LPPGGTLFYQWTFEGWKKDFGEAVLSGKSAVYAVGEVKYTDAFGRARFTKYRLVHGKIGDFPRTEGKFSPTMEGNETN